MEDKVALKSLRIGMISFINTIPFYHQLFDKRDSVLLKEGVPAQINQWMQSGEVDFAPISSMEYALHPDQYVLLPDLCIGSRDFSRSVLLLSHEKIEGLNEETIVLTSKSLSSRALLKILLKVKYRFDNFFVESDDTPEKMLQKGKAALVIGDEALFYKSREFVYKYDLSELWWNWHQLPFCFSLWAVRKEFFLRQPQVVMEFYKKLKANTEHNLLDLESLIRDSLGYTLADDYFSAVFGYLFNLNYYIDEPMLKGLNIFYEYAQRIGLVPKVAQLKFLESPR